MSETGGNVQGLLDIHDVARLYRVHPQTVRDWSRLSRIPGPVVRKHKFTRWSAAEIQADIAALGRAELQEAAS